MIYQHSLPPVDCILLSDICGKIKRCWVLDVCYYYQVLEKFGLFCVEFKATLGLNCVPEHAQDEYLILVWAVSAFGSGLCMKCSLKLPFLTSAGC